MPESGVVAVSGWATCTRSGSRPRTSPAICASTVCEALADAGGARADFHAVVQHLHDAPADVAVPHAEPGVLERAGHARPAAAASNFSFTASRHSSSGGVRSRQLSVGKRVAGPHGVAPPDLPRRESRLSPPGHSARSRRRSSPGARRIRGTLPPGGLLVYTAVPSTSMLGQA